VGLTKREYYLDPRRDYVPVRKLHMTADGVVGWETEIEYEEDPEVGFVPSQLVMKTLDRSTGELTRASVYDVNHVGINVPIEDDEFVVDLPPGTRVRDRIRDASYVVAAPEESRTEEAQPTASPAAERAEPTPAPRSVQPSPPAQPAEPIRRSTDWTAWIGLSVSVLGFILMCILLGRMLLRKT
jgi:hypothetical protein